MVLSTEMIKTYDRFKCICVRILCKPSILMMVFTVNENLQNAVTLAKLKRAFENG